MRSLVNDDRSRLIHKILKHFAPLFFIGRKETLEHKSSRVYPRHCQRRYQCARSGERCHPYPCLVAHISQHLTGIGYRGSSRIGDQRNIFSVPHLIDKFVCLIIFIIFMITGKRYFDIKMIEQLNAVSRILRGNDINISQRFKNTLCYVPEVSYRCCAQI